MQDLEQQLRDRLPVDEHAELDRALTILFDDDESSLPIDMGLEVMVRPVPADEWDESHAHALPTGGAGAIFHLIAPQAQSFDKHLDQFIVEWGEDRFEGDAPDPADLDAELGDNWDLGDFEGGHDQ